MPKLICEYEIGRRARIAVGDDIEGIITAVIFRSEAYHTYELTWVHDGEVKSGWFLAIDLKISGEGKGTGAPALAPRPERTEEKEQAKAKFKRGDRVRVREDLNTDFRNRTGIVERSDKGLEAVWYYDIRFEAPNSFLGEGWQESELEAVVEVESETPEAKFKKGDRVRLIEGVMSMFAGKVGVVESVALDPDGKWLYRIKISGEKGHHDVPQFYETTYESCLGAIEAAGAGGFDSE